MKSFLKGVIICLFSAISFIASAQTDTTDYDVYDVIYLKKGGVLKGEIMSFDEPTGGIVFKDLQGRTYSFSREEYSYFKENQVFERKKKKTPAEIHPRKENEFEFGIGLSANFLTINEDFTSDDYYIQGSNGSAELPSCFDVSFGKYFSRKHYFGVTGDIELSAGGSYFAGGGRYMHQYDANKGNVGLYIPIELKYTQFKSDLQYATSDTTFIPGGYEYPTREVLELNMNTMALSLGHGFAFILNNKKSMMLEVAVVKHFVMSSSFPDEALDPKATFSAVAFRFGAKFNF